jgi:hypothetical protein
MANPTPGDVYVSTPLTNVAIGFMQSDTEFVASRVFPNVPVQFQSGTFWKYSRAAWNRTDAKPRAPGTESAGSGWDLETDTYYANVKAVHTDIDDQTRANADTIFNLDRDGTEFVTRQILLRRELDWVTNFLTAGVWDTDLTGVAAAPGAGQFLQWNDAASTPIADIKAQVIALTQLTGFRPNTLVLGPEVYDALTEHPDIIERIKYSERGIVGNDLLAALLGVPRIFVPYAVRNTAAEGAAESNAFIHSTNALLVYAAPNAGIRTPSGGYTFSWRGYLGMTDLGTRVKKFRMEEIASDRIEAESAYDMQVVAPEMGTLFASAVA